MDYADMHAAVLRGDAQAVADGVQASLEVETPAADILDNGLVPPMIGIGELFEAGEVYVPEMLIAAHAMKAGMQILRPELVKAGIEPIGKVAIGTVQGDLHDIGKNLVAMMMEGAGIEVIDLGVDVSSEEFVEAVKNGVDVLGMSGLLTTTIPAMPRVIQAIEEAGIRDQVRIMIGGAPVTESFAEEIGADGYAPDAASAVRVVKGFLIA